MRQNKYLIKEAKQNTNTTDNEAISDELCIRLLNRAQDFIYSYIFNSNPKTKIFRDEYAFTSNISQDEYPLPPDIYAVNSISNVQQVNGFNQTKNFFPVRQISEKDRGLKLGYFVTRNKFILSPIPFSNINYLVAYTRKLPELGISYGTIATVNPTSLVLSPGYGDMTDVADFFSVVDSSGVIVLRDLPVSQSGGTLTVPSTTGAAPGMVVVPGARATTHCQMPDELESTLIFMLEKLINARLSSTDLNMASALTQQQLDEIAEMFADNSGDAFMPPIVEYTEWG